MPRLILLLAAAVLSCLSPANADDARIRAEVEGALADLSRAVIAGDRAAFMAGVDPSDARWLAEQRHWSDELATYRPIEFSMSIGEGATSFSDSAAEVPLTVTWRFENGLKNNWGMDAKGRSVRFPAVTLTKRDGRWFYCGEKWKEIAGPDHTCIVRFLPGSEKVAEDVLKAFPVSKTHVDSVFKHAIAEVQTIKLYRSMDHLKATVYLNMPDAVLGGWNEPGESIKFMDTYTRGVAGWTGAFAHEYAHAATWELGQSAHKMPWWVEEGIAEQCAEPYRNGFAARVDASLRKLSADGKLPEWHEISDYLTTAPNLKNLAYTQGFHMVSYITAQWKPEGRNAWLAAMAAGRSIEEATAAVLGIPFKELDRRWRESLKTPAPEKKAADDPAEVRAALDQLLRDMTTAVAAANQEGYLSHVSRSDAVFFKEQQNWAKDLARIAPESIEIALDDQELKLESSGAAVGLLTMKWRMPKGRDRSITFPARFVRGEVGWLYAGENWNVLEGDRSRVLYEDEKLKDVAAAVAEVLPDIRTHVHEGFELTEDAAITSRVQQVKLYTSMKHLQHSIYLSYTDGLSGWNEPDEAIKILANPGTGKNMLRILLAHEYGHVATFHLGPKSTDMPWWILEGVAEMSSEKFGRGGKGTDRTVKMWAKTDKLVAWDKLADFHGEAANHQQNVYTQGHHMVSYISEHFGRSSRNAWLRELAQGTGLDDATRKVLGLPFDELDKKWRESLAEVKEEKPADKPEPSQTK